MHRIWMAGIAALAAMPVSGCALDRQTDPQRTATEELLISTAADRAADSLTLDIGKDRKAFLDATDFEGLDGKYAIAAIRASLLRKGVNFVGDKKDADTIVEIRNGALSIDKHGTLVGIPAVTLPIPLAGPVSTPELAFYKYEEQDGVAKFAATAYDAKSGRFIAESTPPLGTSHLKKHVILVISWTHDDIHGNDGHGDQQQSTTVVPGGG